MVDDASRGGHRNAPVAQTPEAVAEVNPVTPDQQGWSRSSAALAPLFALLRRRRLCRRPFDNSGQARCAPP
jgi:hypothetical protein